MQKFQTLTTTSAMRNALMQAEIDAFRKNIAANVLRGRAYPSSASPLMEAGSGVMRAVECVRDDYIYEVKANATDLGLERTSAEDELMFPAHCKYSGFIPRLLIFNDTPVTDISRRVLNLLTATYLAQGGEVFTGEACWDHLKEIASPNMRSFIDKYCLDPWTTWSAA